VTDHEGIGDAGHGGDDALDNDLERRDALEQPKYLRKTIVREPSPSQ
jgi:hypothetical protein